MVRGDAGTVASHLEALDDLDVTGVPGEHGDTSATYRALAKAALSRARLPEESRAAIQGLLEDHPPVEEDR